MPRWRRQDSVQRRGWTDETPCCQIPTTSGRSTDGWIRWLKNSTAIELRLETGDSMPACTHIREKYSVRVCLQFIKVSSCLNKHKPHWNQAHQMKPSNSNRSQLLKT